MDLMCRLNAFRKRKKSNYLFVTIALFSAFFSPKLQVMFSGSDGVKFSDNQTANAISVKEYPSAPDLGRMLIACCVGFPLERARGWYTPTFEDR